MEHRKQLKTTLSRSTCLSNGARVHYVIMVVSKFQWKPFWLATQLYPQNDWTGWQFGVDYDIRVGR